ncbi:Virulence factor mviM homolog [Serratia fonticola]|uniref:Virulence factor mviM homolog n=1 Tax=Serratia fonticola TaxID=47917 RepID=A0A4U9TND1_SERFO|nr:Virulence factor mviM homolog [Serratia fonticola]
MHRRAGSQRESVQAVTNGAVYQLNDMRQWLREDPQGVLEKPAPGWQTTLEQRGFAGAVHHFIQSSATRPCQKPPENRPFTPSD